MSAVNDPKVKGATLREIKEVLLQSATSCGYTVTLSALLRFKLYYGLSILFHRQEPEPLNLASQQQLEMYFNEILDKQDSINPTIKQILKEDLIKIWSRPNLSFLDRCLIAIAGCVNRHNKGLPLVFYLELALKAGATHEQIRQTILFVSEYGLETSWEILEEVDAYLQNQIKSKETL